MCKQLFLQVHVKLTIIIFPLECYHIKTNIKNAINRFNREIEVILSKDKKKEALNTPIISFIRLSAIYRVVANSRGRPPSTLSKLYFISLNLQ